MWCWNIMTPQPALTNNASLRALLAIACLVSTAALAGEPPAQPPVIPEEVDLYARELTTISNDPGASVGVEGLLRLGERASDALRRSPSPGAASVLERLSNEEFQVVVRKMKGFVVNRQETIDVKPDPAFFIALAKRAGDQASVEFFQAYQKTRPNGWAVYIDQQTDYGGCIRFGTLSLLGTYRMWDMYRNKYPTRYRQEVRGFVRDIEDELTDGVCACDDKESVFRELKAFLRAFPRANISRRIRERMDQMHNGMSEIREHCISG